MMVSGGITVTGMIDGENGYSTAVVQLFRRYTPTQANPTPALPTGTLTYTFSTGVLSGASASFNGWSQAIPAADGGAKLFVTMATARSQGATDTIAASEWSTPVEYVADGMAYAPVTIYKRSASAPTDKPDNNARYYFKTVGSGASQVRAGTLVAPSGGSLNGWGTEIPATNAAHDPCWTRQATAVARASDDYDEIGSTEWSDPVVKFVEDGAQGTSPWVADLDNQMDSVSCDDTGNTVSAQTVETTARLYYGSTRKDVDTPAVTRNGTAVTIGTASGGVTVGWNAATGVLSVAYAAGTKVGTAAHPGKDEYGITLTATTERVIRTLDFTVNGIVGDVYNLKPAVDEIHASRNGAAYEVGGSSTYSLTCGYKRKVNGEVTTVDDVTAPASGDYAVGGLYNVYFRRHTRNPESGDGWGTTYYLYTNATYRRYLVKEGDNYGLNLNTYDAVEFILCTNKTGTTTVPANIIDEETVHVIADGQKGTGQPDYIQTQEAWSSAESVANDTTEPTPNGGWSDTTPANPSNYAYLWRRSRKMVLQADGTYAAASGTDGQWKYTRLSGTNGTSIKTKGNAVYVAAASSSFPTTGLTANDIALEETTKKPYKWNGSSWSTTGMADAQDGDSYVITRSCTFHDKEVMGHLVMWSDEANSGNGAWIDLGQFKGDNGTTYYTHIAWASAVTIGTTPSGHTTTGQTTTPNASAVTGFSIAPFDGAAWMGVLINTESSDSNDGLAYTWQKVEGPQGDDGSYYVDEYARYTTRDAGPSGAPTGSRDTSTGQSAVDQAYGWTSTAPPATNLYPYIWKRSALYNPNTSTYGGWSYVCLTGARGSAGATGAMYYIMGIYKRTSSYTRTSKYVPLVFYDNGSGDINPYTGTTGDYWFVKEGVTTVPAGQYPSDNSQYWEKADSFGLVITSGIFANFAKLGSAIMSGDYMFSMNGRIGNTEYNGGATIDGVPAYTYFISDDDKEFTEGYFEEDCHVDAGGYDWFNGRSFTLKKGMTLTARTKGRQDSSRTGAFLRLYDVDDDGSNPLQITVDGDSATEIRLRYSTEEHTVVYTATSDITLEWRIYNKDVYEREYYLQIHHSISGYFEPNWWVDLKTGKMVAARGNFVVQPDGDVEVKGTIRADNFFHNLCVVTGWQSTLQQDLEPTYYSTKWYYCISVTEDQTREDGYEIGKYYDGNVDPYVTVSHDFVPCTYAADIIALRNNASYDWPSGREVYLPRPQDFPGKTIEVRHNATNGNNSATLKVCDGSAGFAEFQYNDQGNESMMAYYPVVSRQINVNNYMSLYSYYFEGSYYWRVVGLIDAGGLSQQVTLADVSKITFVNGLARSTS